MHTVFTGVHSALQKFCRSIDLRDRYPRSYRWTKRLVLPIGYTVLAVMLSLWFTPSEEVTAYGQTVEVGAAGPSFNFSGPGVANLFGEGTLDTVQHFDGPIRPSISWLHFNRNQEAGQFIQSKVTHGKRVVTTNTHEVGQALATGWTHYFVRFVLYTGLMVIVPYLLWLGLRAMFSSKESTIRRGQRWRFVLPTAVFAMLVASGCVALTAMSATEQLGQVTNLADLVGNAHFAPVPAAVGNERKDVDIVVIGDSTAAAIGNTPVSPATSDDKACQRSSDAYGPVLQTYTGLRVLNLACSGATLASGLLDTQYAGGHFVPPQLGVLKSITSASVVIVSIGANDVNWSDSLHLCYGLASCNDNVTNLLFASRLDAFKVQYAQLLQQLVDLPANPTVIVNLYYNPFGNKFDCHDLQDAGAPVSSPAGYSFSADPGHNNQAQKIHDKIDPLTADLNQLNDVLREGAKNFGFLTATPHFEGHELCSDQSWVQGLSDRAPFHPTAAGELAIAAADQPLIPAPKPLATTNGVTAAGSHSESPGP